MNTFGLTSAEAAESKEKYGANRLTEQKTQGFWEKLRDNFGDPMIKILCVALAVNIILVIGSYAGWIEDDMAWYEPVGIAAAILLATLVSTFSEYRNENAFQKLQEEASKILCKVYRNGEIIEMPIDDMVVGDAALLQTGDKIPADGVIIDGAVKVDQSVLNGESKEASKSPVPADYKEDENAGMDFLNPYKVFRGSVVCSGNAVMETRVVGDGSVYGQIAKELQSEDDRETPLKVKLGGLADTISRFGYLGGAAIAAALLFQRIVLANQFDPALISAYASNWSHLLNDVIHAVMLAVIIIVMAVPEGLPLMIAIVSALNMGKMLKDNVLVRKIAGIETAGSLNYLFSDKTGTITKGKLEVVAFIDGSGKEYKTYEEVSGGLKACLSLSIHQNTDSVISGAGAQRKIIGGNATDRAVLGFSMGEGIPVSAKTAGKIPFNSTNKYSASTIGGDYALTLIKGAPEKILEKCRYYYDAQGNKTPYAGHKDLNAKIDALAERAIRVLAFAVSEDSIINNERLPENDWILVGVAGIRDEVRPESVTAIKEVHEAGVHVVMITGDRRETAVAIAKDALLLQHESDIVLTSDELGALSDDAVKKKIPFIKVVARALPSDKSRLVRLTQELNYVVGMTGDGVNDSPALKKADVGFAMGGGTEVAKEASDIVILDDNFNSIDKAILYGRTIFNSIRKFIVFQLTINVSAVLINFVAPLFGHENPLTITQILWINLVMDTLAALAFGGEPALSRFMREKPKRRDEPIVSPAMWSAILTGALWTFGLSALLLFARLFMIYFPEDRLYTGYFAFFVFTAVFNAFNARTDKLNLFDNIRGNRNFLRILGVITAVQIVLVYMGGAVFNCHGLTVMQWALVLACAVSIIPLDLIRKLFFRAPLRGF
ncbi:MAG: calcium-translocating P-type ATPase, PMCA-type [Spirochaetaceae bacterium]|jgi:calcium-translocating P-type ATPase|nr:calcium-translocating P-type ATPase, PMCA-type [Spirochaetaceae bacterium]